MSWICLESCKLCTSYTDGPRHTPPLFISIHHYYFERKFLLAVAAFAEGREAARVGGREGARWTVRGRRCICALYCCYLPNAAYVRQSARPPPHCTLISCDGHFLPPTSIYYCARALILSRRHCHRAVYREPPSLTFVALVLCSTSTCCPTKIT